MEIQTLTYFVFQTHTAFIPFRSIYQECFLLIDGEPKLHPLFCLKNTCHRNASCMEVLAKRVYYFFNEIEPAAQQLITYFKVGVSLKAGVFNKDLSEPRLITLNQSGFDKFKKDSEIKQWIIKQEFINIHNKYVTDNLILAESLIRK